MPKYRITETTDEQHCGMIFEPVFPLTLCDGSVFTPDTQIDLGLGRVKFFNSNYIIEAEVIEDGEDNQ